MYMVWIGVKDLEHPWFELVYRWISITFGWTSDLVTQSIASIQPFGTSPHAADSEDHPFKSFSQGVLGLCIPRLLSSKSDSWIMLNQLIYRQGEGIQSASPWCAPLASWQLGVAAKNEGWKSWSPLTPDVEAVEVHFFFAFTLPALPNSFFGWGSSNENPRPPVAWRPWQPSRPVEHHGIWTPVGILGTRMIRMATVWLPCGYRMANDEIDHGIAGTE